MKTAELFHLLFRWYHSDYAAVFVVVGSVYGITVGKIKSSRDIPAYMTDSMKDMASYIVLILRLLNLLPTLIGRILERGSQ